MPAPLKNQVSSTVVAAIGRSLATAAHHQSFAFDHKRFEKQATRGLADLELTPRGIHVASAWAGALADCLAFQEKLRLFDAAVSSSDCASFKDLQWLPFGSYLQQLTSEYVAAEQGGSPESSKDFAAILESQKQLTCRFTSEFSIRPLVEHMPRAIFPVLHEWTQHDSEHVRRLVSEGTRPRLPWSSHIRALREDPAPSLPLLERLKWDESLYVRRSVANHVGDILKDNREIGLKLCRQWVAEAKKTKSARAVLQQRRAKRSSRSPAGGKVDTDEAIRTVKNELLWVVRHALRLPDKNGDAAASALRKAARKQ